MESRPISNSNALKPYTNDDVMYDLQTTHKNVISSVVNTIGKNIVVGVSDLPTRVICAFKNMESIAFEKLKQVYLLGKSIDRMTILFMVRQLIVEVKKESSKPSIIKIKKDRPTMKKVDAYVSKFLKNSDINATDERVVSEIIKMFFRWTWGKLAAKIKVSRTGGKYLFAVFNLRTLSYSNLSQLAKVHDSVKNINVNFKLKTLHFEVVCADEYISLQNKTKKPRLL